MEWFLVAAALACNPGDRLIDLSSKIPRGLKSMDFVVSVEPFYTNLASPTACSIAAPTNAPRL
jgi:hypothetical protein